MKKITLIFLALAVVINSFSVANVQSEAAENDIENEVHTEILEQSGKAKFCFNLEMNGTIKRIRKILRIFLIQIRFRIILT